MPLDLNSEQTSELLMSELIPLLCSLPYLLVEH